MAALPSGTVTFLFTDVEGSTRLWDEHAQEMSAAVARHDELLRRAVGSHGGQVVKTTGDGCYAVFASAHDAVGAALDAQWAFGEEEWRSTRLRVRMGLHTGEAELREGDYFGGVVNRAARLMNAGHGGQVLVSQVTAELVGDSLPIGVALRDLGAHRLRDLSRPERVFQVLGPRCGAEFPPLRTFEALPGNLPAQVTSFVGRSTELGRVREALRLGRLVTLTGVGGVGKTRLALEVAAAVMPEFRDGAWLVELAGVRDPDLVADAVVQGFGLQPRAGSSADETLLEFLESKALLLLLDNCEHLLRPVGSLVGRVMRACPAVRVLTTSREGLTVAGEHMLGVASLGVPEEADSLDAIAACDAVLLFVERARAVKASFALDSSNAGAVAQVCRRLDGIPLAIELAAARVGTLSPAELARRLDQRFRLLAGGQRGVVERHQTLRAAIDWSYELLSEAERVLLARVSVFAGGFTLEAAEAVTVGGAVEMDAVFDVLASLVARSLIVADTEAVDTRFGLLETIRQYAQERLDESGRLNRLRFRHAEYYSDFGERAGLNTSGADGLEWERRLDQESDNFRAAMAWAIDTQDTDIAVRLLAMWNSPSGQTSDYRYVASMVRWTSDAVLGLPGAAEHPKYPAALVTAASGAFWLRGDPKLAVQLCDEAVTAGARLVVDPGVGRLVVRSNVALGQGRADDAVEFSRQAIDLARARSDLAWLIQALSASAVARTMVGDRVGALAAAEEILSLRYRLPNTASVQNAVALGAFALSETDPQRALAVARQLVALLGPSKTQMAWAVVGDIAASNDERLEALAYFDKGINVLYWMGNRTGLGTTLGRVAALIADDDPEEAALLLGAADAMASEFAHSRRHLDARRHADATLEMRIGTLGVAELHAQGETMSESEATQHAHTAISRLLHRDMPE
jgi:predicted ATPase/class 3 adenylate cyclase